MGGRYTVLRPIGEGGSARVYLVRETGSEALLAIKVLKPRFAGRSDLRRRVLAEARTMASLHHPGLLKVHAWGTDGMSPYIAMEYAPGGSTSAWVRRYGAIPALLAVDLARQVAEAVLVAHDHDVVHRDLKPDNVLLAADGSARVADFGIARIADGEGLTKTGMTIGTVGYMAPEQFDNPRTVDPRADVYGLGATLWFWITGSVPAHVFHSDPWEAGIPGPLCPALGRATAFEPHLRQGGMRAILADLERAAAQLPPLDATAPSLAPLPHEPGDAGTLYTGGAEDGPTWVDRATEDS